ncbi:MAG TPA: hypothetical protein VLF89_09425 [Candidatus Saccharimonadales bacterium]|nr:hypothetical protein [Candidatus Saccharimonadales bacterium]
MITRKKRYLCLFLAIFSLCAEIYVVRTVPPDMQFSLANVNIPIIVIFFLLLFSFLFFLITFLFKKILQGILLALFTNIYMLFRYFGFTKLLYQILLLLIFISIELFFFQKRQEKQ